MRGTQHSQHTAACSQCILYRVLLLKGLSRRIWPPALAIATITMSLLGHRDDSAGQEDGMAHGGFCESWGRLGRPIALPWVGHGWELSALVAFPGRVAGDLDLWLIHVVTMGTVPAGHTPE